MDKDLSAVQQVAQMMYSGETILEANRAEFWANTQCSNQSGFADLSSVTVRYTPKPAEKRDVVMGVAYGQALDNSIEEYPERVADAMKRAHAQMYSMYFLDVRSILMDKVDELVGWINRPIPETSFAIYAENLPDLRNQLYTFRMAAQRAGNIDLVNVIMDIDLAGFSTYQENSKAVLHFVRSNYGNMIRISDEAVSPAFLNISPLLHWLNDPTKRTFSRADIQAVIDYNEKL